jgi:integrase
MQALTQEEATRFLDATRGRPWHTLFALLLSTGLRPSEAIALRWTDLDLANDRLTVRRKATRVEGKWIFEAPKTSKSRRTIDLPHGTTRLLSEHLHDGDLVFTNGRGDPPALRSITRHQFKPALERAGLSGSFRLYDLRHTHATLLLVAGIHPKIVSERLGHSTITITMDTYSHVLPGMQRESASKIGEMLFKSTVEKSVEDAALN